MIYCGKHDYDVGREYRVHVVMHWKKPSELDIRGCSDSPVNGGSHGIPREVDRNFLTAKAPGGLHHFCDRFIVRK
jgi:hypothetical protein